MTPTDDIAQQLQDAQRLLQSYLDLSTEQVDDESYVARGNGFCDRKYSDDFIDLQVAQLTARIADLENKMQQHDI